MYDEFEDFKGGPSCPAIPSSIMEALPMPVYSLDDPTVMDPPLSNYSQEKMDSSKLPASNNLAVEPTESLSSSYVEPQAIPTPLVPACLNMDCTTNATMVVALTLAAHDTPVNTRGPCHDTLMKSVINVSKFLVGRCYPLSCIP